MAWSSPSTMKPPSSRSGPYRAILTEPDFAWTGHTSAKELLRPGDIAQFSIREVTGSTAKVQLEQDPGPQAALLAIDNASGEIKAMVGGYDFRGFEIQSRRAGPAAGWKFFQGVCLCGGARAGLYAVRYDSRRSADRYERRPSSIRRTITTKNTKA